VNILWTTRNTSTEGSQIQTKSPLYRRECQCHAQGVTVELTIDRSNDIPGPPEYVLTTDEIRDFQVLIKEETGVDLPVQEAWNRAIAVIALTRMLIGPMPEDPEM
jgi:hypothetical protein